VQIIDYQQQKYQTYLLQNQSPQVSAFNNNLHLLASAPQPQSRSASSSPK